MITCLTCGRALTPGGPACCPKLPMSDHLDHAAAIVGGCCAHCDDLVGERLALLDEAGLLVSPERDAAVAAKVLREAADELYGDDRAAGPYSHPLSAASWLRDRADRIERGESNADT